MRCFAVVTFLLLKEASSGNVECWRKSRATFTDLQGNVVKKTYNTDEVIFFDDFSNPEGLNESIWKYETNMNGGGNQEFQIYAKNEKSAYIRDNTLFLKPVFTTEALDGVNENTLYNGELILKDCNSEFGLPSACERIGNPTNILPPIVSTRIRTKGAFSFRYGKIEFYAKLPSGDWTWPALWLLPEDNAYGNWPMSGEIDVMESIGNKKFFFTNSSGYNENIGVEQVSSTLHFGMDLEKNGYDNFWAAHEKYNTKPNEGFDKDFHIFRCDWTPDSITFYVDDKIISEVNPNEKGFFELGKFDIDFYKVNPWAEALNLKMAPFDKDFHLVMNVAVGGLYFKDQEPNNGIWNEGYAKPWINSSPTSMTEFWRNKHLWEGSWMGENSAMQIKWVRVTAI